MGYFQYTIRLRLPLKIKYDHIKYINACSDHLSYFDWYTCMLWVSTFVLRIIIFFFYLYIFNRTYYKFKTFTRCSLCFWSFFLKRLPNHKHCTNRLLCNRTHYLCILLFYNQINQYYFIKTYFNVASYVNTMILYSVLLC